MFKEIFNAVLKKMAQSYSIGTRPNGDSGCASNPNITTFWVARNVIDVNDDNGSDDNGSDGNGSDGNESDGNGSDGNESDGNGSDGNGSDGNGIVGNESVGNESDGYGSDGYGSVGNGIVGNECVGNKSDGNESDANGSDGNGSDANAFNNSVPNPDGGTGYAPHTNASNGYVINKNCMRMNHYRVLRKFRIFQDLSGKYCVECTTCHRLFAAMSTYFFHYSAEHGHNLLVNNVCRIIDKVEAPLQCLLCWKSYLNMDTFIRHATEKYTEFSACKAMYRCRYCSRFYASVYQMLIHLGRHVWKKKLSRKNRRRKKIRKPKPIKQKFKKKRKGKKKKKKQ